MDVNDVPATAWLSQGVSRTCSSVLGAPATIKREGAFLARRRAAGKGRCQIPMAYALMSGQQISEFERDLEMNLASRPASESGRFRANVYVQRGEVAMVIRYINHVFPISMTWAAPVLGKLSCSTSGLNSGYRSTGLGLNRPRWLPCSTTA